MSKHHTIWACELALFRFHNISVCMYKYTVGAWLLLLMGVPTLRIVPGVVGFTS
jgi:hypothetical protein